MDGKILFRYFCGFLGAFIAVIYFAAPTEEDIAECVAVTNYTAERCEWEMTR